MKISWTQVNDGDDKSIEAEICFHNDEQTKILHTLTVVVDNPDKYIDRKTAMRLGGGKKALDEIIPALQAHLTESLKTEYQLEMEAKAKADTE